jgi:hypothetical protein
MAHTEIYPTPRLAAVAAQLGPFLGFPPHQAAAPAFAAAERTELAGSFAVWTVSLEDFRTTGAAKASWNHVWHHQKRPAGAAADSFVRTRDQEGAAPEIRGVYHSPLAAEIDRAIDGVGSLTAGSAQPTVRILEIPELRLAALWIRHGTANQYIPLGKFASPADRQFEPIGERDLVARLPHAPLHGLSV